jgi:putative ATPase
MKSLDYGRDYRYAHDEPDAYAAGARYFPDALDPPPRFYEPPERGLEIKIGAKLAQLRRRDAAWLAEHGLAEPPDASDV